MSEAPICGVSDKVTTGRNSALKTAIRKARLAITVISFAFCTANQPVRAQLYTGSISGTTTDSSGAVLPSANVTLLDQERGFTFKAATNSSGGYVLRSIPPGTYKITVEAQDFQSQSQDGITLDVNQHIAINFSLKVGASNVVVNVSAESVHLQTEDAVTGQVVNRKFVNDLPLIDRNFANLAYLAPGVTETNAPGTASSNGGINFNSNGSRNSTADVLIDGASATNFEQNSGLQNVPYVPSVDSVEEFKVQQSNFSAEYGFASGAIINVVTRSGTNQFHGSAYEFFRDSAMDANTWFNNANGQPIAGLRRNDFGGTIGGPIRRDKTFFFVNYEGTRETDSASSGLMGVPSLCERGDPSANCPVGTPALGNFGELCILQGGTFDSHGMCSNPAGQLWDPYTSTFQANPPSPDPNNPFGPGAVRSNFIPFNNMATYVSPGNPNLVGTPFGPAPGVPGNIIDPVARNLFQLFPKPTVNATDFGTLQNANFFSSGSQSNNNNQFDIKVDNSFGQHDLASVRYSQRHFSSGSFNCFGNFADPCTGGPGTTTSHEIAITDTHTFNPATIMTITYGYVRRFDGFPGIRGDFPNIDSSFAQVGFPQYLNNGFGVMPAILISGYSSGNAGNNIGTQTFSITREGQDSQHLGGSVSLTRGKQDLKFGGEMRIHRINHGNPGWPSGAFSFDFTSTSQVSTASDPSSVGGDGMASFLTGVGSPNLGGGGCTPCQQGFNNFVSTQSFRYGAFAQDNYKVTPKLTLNIGIRYELSIPRTERFNRMNSLDPNAVSPLQVAGLPTLHGIEVFASPSNRHNYATDYTNIQPRIGFAYSLPHASAVLRGGYGIYFSTPRSGASGTGPWGFQGFNIQPPWLTTLNIDHATPWNTLSNTSCAFVAPFTCSVAPAPGNSLGAFNDIGFTAVGPIKKISQNTPYEQAWSLGIQQEGPWKILFDMNYIGKKGTHLYLGGFRENNYLPFSQVAGLSPSDIGNLTNLVANPFYFDPTQFPAGTQCDRTKFICDPTSALGGPQVPQYQLSLPYPQYTGFQGDSPPIANSIYNALQLRAEKQFANGLQFLATYTWSKSIDDASASDDSFVFLGGGTTGGSTLAVQNPFDLGAERAVSVFDIPQVFQFSYIFELPLGRGRRFGGQMNPILNGFIGGWQTNGIIRVDDGRPIIPLLQSSTPIPTYGQRPNLSERLQRARVSPQKTVATNANPASYFANPGALSQTSAYTFGNAPRTISSVRQPGARDVSMSLFKQFPMTKFREGMNLEFRAESFNTFNHPHFQGPNATVGASDFGLISSTVNDPRQLQLALKLYF